MNILILESVERKGVMSPALRQVMKRVKHVEEYRRFAVDILVSALNQVSENLVGMTASERAEGVEILTRTVLHVVRPETRRNHRSEAREAVAFGFEEKA